MSEDARELRQQSRERWTAVAEGWERHAERMRSITMPVSAWMIDAIDPQPGHQLLELAAGVGETGFLAAELIAPGGTLLTTDFSPGMLSVAQRRAQALGLRNVRFRQIDAEAEIDLPAASVDGVLCRWGFMLMQDPGAALRETRRVLRPGGRLALAVWASPDDNPWAATPGRVLVREGLVEPPDPQAPGQFSWADPTLIESHLEDAGFDEIEVDRVALTFAWPDFETYWQSLGDVSMMVRTAIGDLGPEALALLHDKVRAAVQQWMTADGSLDLPAETWVAAATA